MSNKHPLSQRFRGFLPVIIDVETGGFHAETDALLEIAAVTVTLDHNGLLRPDKIFHEHVTAFHGANISPKALEFNRIDPQHPFRFAVSEEVALDNIFFPIRNLLRQHDCFRAVLTGHNAFFDLGFLNAAIKRNHIKHSPFHSFTTFDTATLAALAYGQTVLAKAVAAAGIPFNNSEAHSALYDAEKTAALFCNIVNRWDFLAKKC